MVSPRDCARAAAALISVQLLVGCELLNRQCETMPAVAARERQWESDNRNLRKELDEAHAKIKALTAIERDLDSPGARNQGRSP
jgi:hypothetical protein